MTVASRSTSRRAALRVLLLAGTQTDEYVNELLVPAQLFSRRQLLDRISGDRIRVEEVDHSGA
ncbi:MAG TPA: hypothetical protein VHF46_05615 [Rubrobacteraceae bacterium]|nr:hypothetical protein [Rubrobacteraceae bacterium]